MKLLEACFRKALWNLAESFAKQRIWGKLRFPNNRCKSSVFHNLIMMYSVTPFGFWLISQPGLFLGLTYDLSVYVAPRMSKHYLKQCFIRYFNMQFSKNNVVSDFGIIKLRWMLAFIICFIVSKALATCQWATSSAWSFDHIFYLWVLTHSGDKGIRTLDPLLARQVLSQLSYTPIKLLLSKNQNVL